MAIGVVRLISTDGESELTISGDYMGQERPAFSFKSFDRKGNVVTAEFPLMPDSLITIVSLLLDSEHKMLAFISKEFVKSEMKRGENFETEESENVIPFPRKP